MKIDVKLVTRYGDYYADGIFEDGSLLVKKGGKINLDFAEHIRGGDYAKQYREDALYVDELGNILEDCFFSSPSTASQFVTGRSSNGYVAWKVEPKKNLGQYLKEIGLR